MARQGSYLYPNYIDVEIGEYEEQPSPWDVAIVRLDVDPADEALNNALAKSTVPMWNGRHDSLIGMDIKQIGYGHSETIDFPDRNWVRRETKMVDGSFPNWITSDSYDTEYGCATLNTHHARTRKGDSGGPAIVTIEGTHFLAGVLHLVTGVTSTECIPEEMGDGRDIYLPILEPVRDFVDSVLANETDEHGVVAEVVWNDDMDGDGVELRRGG